MRDEARRGWGLHVLHPLRRVAYWLRLCGGGLWYAGGCLRCALCCVLRCVRRGRGLRYVGFGCAAGAAQDLPHRRELLRMAARQQVVEELRVWCYPMRLHVTRKLLARCVLAGLAHREDQAFVVLLVHGNLSRTHLCEHAAQRAVFPCDRKRVDPRAIQRRRKLRLMFHDTQAAQCVVAGAA